MYIKTIKQPYKIALLMPFPFEFFIKNDTVNGIIGKIHGVKSAIKPPKKPKTKRFKYS